MTTTTDVAPHGSALSLTTDQDTFTPRQRAMLAHMGVENAPEEDLAVFLHIAQRTGLDPFARQIHMIGRNQKTRMPDGSERWVTKYTIQTGIDGFRVTGRRAADRAKIDVSVPAPEWAHEDGTWRPVWSSKWGRPVAARVTIMRGDRAFVGVALFEEYAQTKRDGGLTQMWAQRPAGQLAKCAEALAWRMAFPQDLAFVYSDDEMHQADNQTGPREVTAEPARATASVFAATADEPEAMSDEQRAALTDLFEHAGIPPENHRAYIADRLERADNRRKLTAAEADAVIAHLRHDLENDVQDAQIETSEIQS